jgi:hypothetical protein
MGLSIGMVGVAVRVFGGVGGLYREAITVEWKCDTVGEYLLGILGWPDRCLAFLSQSRAVYR